MQYSFADCCGVDEPRLKELAAQLAADLNCAVGAEPVPFWVNEEKIHGVNDARLKEWEQKVDALLREVHADPIYQEALAAFQADDQKKLHEMIPSIFSSHAYLALRAHTEQMKMYAPEVLYHGVVPRKVSRGNEGIEFEMEQPKVKEYRSPEKYIDHALRIQQEGLQPSFGFHGNVDTNIGAVFAVDDPADTYGLLFFCMRPKEHGYNVFPMGGGDGYEYMIYTPQLRIPMILYLKSARDVERMLTNEAWKGQKKALRKYHRSLEQIIQKKGLPVRINPREQRVGELPKVITQSRWKKHGPEQI